MSMLTGRKSSSSSSMSSAVEGVFGGTGGGGREGRDADGFAGRDTSFEGPLEEGVFAVAPSAPPFCSLDLGWNRSGLG